MSREVSVVFTLFKSERSSPRQRLYRWQGKAVVETTIQPQQNGRVRFRGSFWNARSVQGNSFFPGDLVEVKGIENITLIVEAVAY